MKTRKFDYDCQWTNCIHFEKCIHTNNCGTEDLYDPIIDEKESDCSSYEPSSEKTTTKTKKYFIEFENIEAGNKIIHMVFCTEDSNDLKHKRDYNTEYLTKLELNYQAGYKATGDVYEIDDETDYDDGISELPEGAEKVDFNPLPFEFAAKIAVVDNFGESATCDISANWIKTPAGSYQVVSEHDSYFDEEDNPGHSEHTNFDGSPMKSFEFENETWYFVKQ